MLCTKILHIRAHVFPLFHDWEWGGGGVDSHDPPQPCIRPVHCSHKNSKPPLALLLSISLGGFCLSSLSYIWHFDQIQFTAVLMF